MARTYHAHELMQRAFKLSARIDKLTREAAKLQADAKAGERAQRARNNGWTTGNWGMLTSDYTVHHLDKAAGDLRSAARGGRDLTAEEKAEREQFYASLPR